LRGSTSGVALVVDSLGGQAESAYQIARMFRRHCGPFGVVVPRIAKSAATLLALGTHEIYMGRDAELGPLDAQLFDADREEWSSALDEVQALERLNSVALELADQAMFLFIQRTGKKIDTVLPYVLDFTAEMMKPLFDKIDTVHYTQRSRVLKVAEDYATRLLKVWHPDPESMARHLVNAYPEHGFVIDREEASELLDLPAPSPELQQAIDTLEQVLTLGPPFTAIGLFEEASSSPCP